MKKNQISQAAGSALVLPLLFLCACNPGPKYVRPPAQTPVAYKETLPQEFKEGSGWKLAQPGDDRIGGKWWLIYNDPQLTALEEQVQVSNQTVLAAEASFRAARALVVSARSSLYPTITANPTYSNSKASATARGAVVSGAGGSSATSTGSGTATGTGTTTGTGTSTSTSTTGSTSTTVTNIFSLPIDATYTLDFWHRIRNTVAANAFSAQASAAEIGTALISIQAEVAQNYFQIRALDAQRKILEETQAAYKQTLDLTKARFQAGIDSDENVAQAQTQLDLATAQTTDVAVARATYEHAIATLIGKPASTFSLAVAPFTPNPPTIPVSLPSELLERRPDIAANERQVAAANAQIGVARAAYYPNLTLSAASGFQTSHFVQWFNGPSLFWSLGPQLTQTLLDFGARRGANEQAQANYDQTVANYRQTVLTAFQAVEDNLSTLRILSQEVGQQQTAVNSANHYLDLALTRYRGGVDSYLNVITAQTTLLTNRETELQIQLRQMTASVGLIEALGGGWDPASLPKMQDLAAKRPKATTTLQQAPVGSVAAPNPPAIPANYPSPVVPQNPAAPPD